MSRIINPISITSVETPFLRHSRTSVSRSSEALEEFLDLSIRPNPLGRIAQKELYCEYQVYCEQQNVDPLKRQTFGLIVEEYCREKLKSPITKHTTRVGQVFKGLSYLPEPQSKTMRQIKSVLAWYPNLCANPEYGQHIDALLLLAKRDGYLQTD